MSDDQSPILEVEGLRISFFTRAGESSVVTDFSFKIMPGEMMGLVGESGCGKSSIAMAIMRDLPKTARITAGTISFAGRDMASMSPRELRGIRGSQISMVYQEPMASLNPAMHVGQQLMEVPIIHNAASRQEAKAAAIAMLKAVRLPDVERLMKNYPHQLSGGQQQRIVIAMALLAKPKLLLLDEPTTALDVTVEAGIVGLLKELGQRLGTAMIFISHNLGLVREICDRLTVMYSGRVVESGTVEDVFSSMRHPYTQALFRAIPLPASDKYSRPLVPIPGHLPLPDQRPSGCAFGPRCDFFKAGTCDVVLPALVPVRSQSDHVSRCLLFQTIDWSAGQGLGTQRAAVTMGETVLEVDDLRKDYRIKSKGLFGGGTALVKANQGISLDARRSETLAIVGESGCGKSTFAKVLLGLETATGGRVLLNGRSIERTAVHDRNVQTVASIQMIFQNPFDTLNPSHTVGSQIVRSLETFKVGKHFGDRHRRMLELLDLVKLPRSFENRMPRQLSGGQKQRIGVARAFAGTPDVIVADEPMSALDVSVQAAVSELLMDVQQQASTTLILISHDMAIVRYLADRIVVMYLGHVVERGTMNEIFAPPYHPYTEALLSAIPLADINYRKRVIVLDGDVPSAINNPPGCPFQTRCSYKDLVQSTLCESVLPPLRSLSSDHAIRCHLPADVLGKMEPVVQEVSLSLESV